MKKRPDKSALKDTYLNTYNSIEACLIQHNFSLLFSRKIENQIYDMIITAQKQKVPVKKLQCNKDLDTFCSNLINEHNNSASLLQKVLEAIFSCLLLFSFFCLLDLIFDQGILVSTLFICLLVSIGYLISSSILKYKKNCTSKIRMLLILGIVFIPFIIVTLLKQRFEFMLISLPFTYSLLLSALFCTISGISYYILSKKYDLFIFTKYK